LRFAATFTSYISEQLQTEDYDDEVVTMQGF
jgi:hypothetical protein